MSSSSTSILEEMGRLQSKLIDESNKEAYRYVLVLPRTSNQFTCESISLFRWVASIYAENQNTREDDYSSFDLNFSQNDTKKIEALFFSEAKEEGDITLLPELPPSVNGLNLDDFAKYLLAEAQALAQDDNNNIRIATLISKAIEYRRAMLDNQHDPRCRMGEPGSRKESGVSRKWVIAAVCVFFIFLIVIKFKSDGISKKNVPSHRRGRKV